MNATKLTIVFFAGSVFFAAIFALVLLQVGLAPSHALLAAGIFLVFLVFLVIPIYGAIRSQRMWNRDTSMESQKRRLSLIRFICFYVGGPLLVGLIFFMTYPSTSLALPLAVIVIVAVSLFYFLTR